MISCQLTSFVGAQLSRSKSAAVQQSPQTSPFRNSPKLRSKASGLLSRLRQHVDTSPARQASFSKMKRQLHVDTTSSSGRRFSFEIGDDNNAALSASPLGALPATVRDRLLRKSVSLSILKDRSSSNMATMVDPALSPVEQSPTTSVPVSECRKLSRIPTPVYNSLARPRREREDSSSSLLTAIRHCDGSSILGSSYSSPSASRTDLTQALGHQGTDLAGGLRAASINPLLELNVLRGSAIVGPSAKIDSAMVMDADREISCSRRKRRNLHNSNNSRSSTQSRCMPDMNDTQKENIGPIRPTNSLRESESDATP